MSVVLRSFTVWLTLQFQLVEQRRTGTNSRQYRRNWIWEESVERTADAESVKRNGTSHPWQTPPGQRANLWFLWEAESSQGAVRLLPGGETASAHCHLCLFDQVLTTTHTHYTQALGEAGSVALWKRKRKKHYGDAYVSDVTPVYVIMFKKCSSKVLKNSEKDHTQPDPACDETSSLQEPSDDDKQWT